MIVYILSFGNGKRYVGITCDLKRRLDEHSRRPGLLRNALKKHGFEILIAFQGERLQCCSEERRLIRELGTLYPAGYNRSLGGEGNDGSEATALAIREGIKRSSFDRSDKAKRQWGDPDQAAKLLRGNASKWSKPGSREANSEKTRQRWTDPVYRERVAMRIREGLSRRRASI